MSTALQTLRTTRTLTARASRLHLASNHPSSSASASATSLLVPRRLAHQESQSSSSSSSSAETVQGAKSRETKNGAQPKFNTQPKESTPDVEKHNEELEMLKKKNAWKGDEGSSDKVERGFWNGNKK